MKAMFYLKKTFMLFIVPFLQSCENEWPTKEQAKKLKGEWRLTSIKAIDKTTFKDTTWSIDECFIRFDYHGKPGATPITYSLAPGQVINGMYSIPSENKLLLMPKDPVSEYESRKVGLPVSHQNYFEISKGKLILTGDCVIRQGNNSLTSRKRMSLIATFER